MIITIDSNALATAEIVANQFADIGATISAVANGSGVDQAMIFDTNNPTGGDDDLATDNLDNVLVISQNGDASAPNDNAMSGVFTFDFEEGGAIKSLKFLDLEAPARLTFLAEDGQRPEGGCGGANARIAASQKSMFDGGGGPE